MVKLLSMPSQAIIDEFKGYVDFYLWKGIPCARAWPYWPPRDPTPTEKANQDEFSYIIHLYNTVSPEILEAYRLTASGTQYTRRDLFIKAFLVGITYTLGSD